MACRRKPRRKSVEGFEDELKLSRLLSGRNRYVSWGFFHEKNIDVLRDRPILDSFGLWALYAVRRKLEQVGECACNPDRRCSLLYSGRDDSISCRQVRPLAPAHATTRDA